MRKGMRLMYSILHETPHTVKCYYCPKARSVTDPILMHTMDSHCLWFLCELCTCTVDGELQEVWHATPMTLEAINAR